MTDDRKTRSLNGDFSRTDVLKGDVVIGVVGGEDARQATELEHNLSFLVALKLYPTAVGWSIFFSLGM